MSKPWQMSQGLCFAFGWSIVCPLPDRGQQSQSLTTICVYVSAILNAAVTR